MYKLVVCNLGYDDSWLCHLDGKTSDDLEGLVNEVNYLEDELYIDGFEIIEKHFDISEDDFLYNDTVFIIETEISDRCIYIMRVEEMKNLEEFIITEIALYENEFHTKQEAINNINYYIKELMEQEKIPLAYINNDTLKKIKYLKEGLAKLNKEFEDFLNEWDEKAEKEIKK